MATQAIEVIPSLSLDDAKLRGALSELDATHLKAEGLRQQAMDLQVKSADQRAQAGQLVTELKDAAKLAEAHLTAFEVIAKKVTDYLRQRRLRTTNLCEEARGILNRKMAEYDRLEQEATAKEQAKLNKAAEKRDEEPGVVKPNIPSVAGNVQRVNWKFKVVKAQKIALKYLEPNMVAIGSRVREVMTSGRVENETQEEKLKRWAKNKAQVEKEIGGIEVFEERSY
jgi:hypothetical protein